MKTTASTEEMLSSIAISYIDESSELIPVSFGRLEYLFPIHSKVITRIFVAFVNQGGVPNIRILGVISEVLKNSEVMNLKLCGEYTDAVGKDRQIWINETEFERVRITIPTTL
jgi:hypothetical protein